MSTVCSAVWMRMESPWPTLSILIVTSLPAVAVAEDFAAPEEALEELVPWLPPQPVSTAMASMTMPSIIPIFFLTFFPPDTINSYL